MSASSSRRRNRALGAALVIAGFASAAPAQVVFGPSRADDGIRDTTADGRPVALPPWTRIGLGPDLTLSLGVDWRERVESVDHPLLGVHGQGSDAYVLHRLLVDGDLRSGPWRAFVQIGAHDESGREGGPLPTDRDKSDLQQAFVEWSGGAAGGTVRVRAGRQEMAYDDGLFVGFREGPNVRRAWDGVRASWRGTGVSADLFSVQPVAIRRGAFDDRAASGEYLGGVHATAALAPTVSVDAFYLYSRMPRVVIAAGAGPASTDVAGVRLRGAWGGQGDAGVGAYREWGRLLGRSIDAYALQGSVGWTFRSVWTPRLYVRADALSGGDPKSGSIRTFNALYPNYSYSTEAAIESPSNLVEAAVGAAAKPTRALSVQYVVERLWRFSRRDAFYAAPGLPLLNPGPAASRAVGVEQQLSGAWAATGAVTFNAALAAFDPSGAVARVGGKRETFAMGSMLVRF